MAKRRPSAIFFCVGDEVPHTGIYFVYHSDHGVSHEITLTSGHTFPPCAECREDVSFELLIKAPASSKDTNFRVQLFEIPHPKKIEGETA